jgi:hypothetical protein
MKTAKSDLFFVLIVLWLFSFNCDSGYASKPVPSKWGILKDGNTLLINAGILEQRINLENQKISSRLFLNGELLNEDFSGELAVVFHKASPNMRPKGIGYSAESGVEQADEVKNQTDALAVKKKKNSIEQGVQWPDSSPISKENFNHVFNNFNSRIFIPEKGVKRLTLTFTSKKIWSDVSLEINYEIYNGYPAIRKWIKFYNPGSQWLKISDLLLEELNLNKKYSHKVLLTPNSRNIDPSILAFSDTTASSGIIASSEVPSKLRHLSVDGTIGYNPDYFEWVIGPGESFVSEPLFIYAFSGLSYPTPSALSTALDRCVEGGFHAFMNERIIRPKSQIRNIAPLFCSWTNYSAAINDSNMRVAAKMASRIGFKCFQLDAGWSDTGPAGGWAVSTPKPNRQNFKDLCGISNYIHSEHMKTGLWYSVFLNEQEVDKSGNGPGLFSLPLIRRAGGVGLSLCYDKSRERYVNDILYLHKTYQAEYFKQDLSNICYGDIAEGHESRTLKESYLRGLRGLFTIQDEIHRQAPEIWLQLSHEIYWETPGPEADIAVLQHVDSYHSAPNEYWGAGNRSKLVNPAWKYNVDSLKQKLIQGALRARTLLYAHRGLPLDRVEVFGAVTTNFKGSLTAEIQDRQICSWLFGAPVSFSGDLGSLTPENINLYRKRFEILENLQKGYNIYPYFQFSGVPVPTDEGWHWWGKLNGEGFGAVVVLRGSTGTQRQRINIPWVKASKKYQLKALFSDENLGVFSGSQLINGELTLSLPPFGQEIIEVSGIPTSQKSNLTGESQRR